MADPRFLRVRRGNGTYGYVQVNDDETPTEFDLYSGKFKIHSLPNLNSQYSWGWKNNDTNDTSGTYLPLLTITGRDRSNVKVGILRPLDSKEVAEERDRRVDELVNLRVGSSDNFTPWGIAGQVLGWYGELLSQGFKDAVNTANNGTRYFNPTYWADRLVNKKSDNQIMNGEGKVFNPNLGGNILNKFSFLRFLKPSHLIGLASGYSDKELLEGKGELTGTGTGNALDALVLGEATNLLSNIGNPILNKALEIYDKVDPVSEHLNN